MNPGRGATLALLLLPGVLPAQEPAPPSPAELWARLAPVLPPLRPRIVKDETAESDTVPGLKLRRVEILFTSQVLEGRAWNHPCVAFLPVGPPAPARRGRVVVVGQRGWDGLATGPWRDPFLGNYGEPIAARTGYPTLVCPVPGEHPEEPGRELSIGFLGERCRRTRDPVDHNYFRLAVPYLRALDAMAGLLGVEPGEIRAVIGGHSKRATSAYTAAAADPERIAGVVYMGNESTWAGWRPPSPWWPLSPEYTQKWVRAEVLYLGATNEDGYAMFNLNRIQEAMGGAWTVEYIPNYRHASMSEKHFLDWQMWVAHVFDGRPLARIGGLGWEPKPDGFRWGGRPERAGTLFRARIEGPNKVIQAKVWYVYCDDEPFWRDLVWYPEFMIPRGDGVWEGFVRGRRPDAWLVEVKDTAQGFPGYLSSLPQDLSGKRVETRISRGSRSRLWRPEPGGAASAPARGGGGR